MPSPVFTFGPGGTSFAFLVSERIYLSREEAVVASGSGILVGGTIMGRVTATGEYRPYLAANSDGSQVAAGILMEDVDATAAAVKRTMLVRLAEVQRSALAFAGTPTTAQKNAAYASLAANHIAMR